MISLILVGGQEKVVQHPFIWCNRENVKISHQPTPTFKQSLQHNLQIPLTKIRKKKKRGGEGKVHELIFRSKVSLERKLKIGSVVSFSLVQNNETLLITNEDVLVPIYVNERRTCASPYKFNDK